MIRTLIDCDVVVYRAGFSSEKRSWEIYKDDELVDVTNDIKAAKKQYGEDIIASQRIELEPLEYALYKAKMIMNHIMDKTNCDDYIGFLSTPSDKTLFRLKFAKTKIYKGNRIAFKKPHYYDAIRDYLKKFYNVKIVKGIEADDALGILQTRNTIIASIDKDLLQIPGRHYNFAKDIFYSVDYFTAKYNFYYQMLIGDTADNIPGLPQIGPKKAEKQLENCKDEKDLFNATLSLYKQKFPTDFKAKFLETANLIYILRKKSVFYKPYQEIE